MIVIKHKEELVSQSSMTAARIYMRRNGEFGARVPDCLDTGHCIYEDSGKFTVWSINDTGQTICKDATRHEAETAIAKDWKA